MLDQNQTKTQQANHHILQLHVHCQMAQMALPFHVCYRQYNYFLWVDSSPCTQLSIADIPKNWLLTIRASPGSQASLPLLHEMASRSPLLSQGLQSLPLPGLSRSLKAWRDISWPLYSCVFHDSKTSTTQPVWDRR